VNKAPPRIPLALRIAARLLPRDAREDVLGDLVEMWHEQKARRSRVGCLLWMWRQPLISLGARVASRTGAKPQGWAQGGGGISWIDVKLGLRLLTKHPMMTLVSGLAVSVTIAVSIGMFTFFQSFILRPTLPIDKGDRVVGFSTRIPGAPYSASARIEVEGLAAAAAGSLGHPVGTTIISANLFDVLEVPILDGPGFTPNDAESTALPVIVDHNIRQGGAEEGQPSRPPRAQPPPYG
jgi:hypothetical protein